MHIARDTFYIIKEFLKIAHLIALLYLLIEKQISPVGDRRRIRRWRRPHASRFFFFFFFFFFHGDFLHLSLFFFLKSLLFRGKKNSSDREKKKRDKREREI